MVAMSGSGWTLAPALKVLIEQVDDAYPTRPRAADGSIGDARHQAEGFSDHNPRRAASGLWYVTAVDVTTASWSQALADLLVQDPRVKYVIFNRRYRQRIRWSSDPVNVWTGYQGSDPHTGHIHVSLQLGASTNTARWHLPGGASPVQPVVHPPAPAPVPAKFPLPAGEWFGVQDGSTPHAHGGTRPADLPPIKAIQSALHVTVDGNFGPMTLHAVRAFQDGHRLTVDGKVGPVTWGRLF